jgi:RNA polymerase sigma-70 factor (ECF subfamily)
MVRAVVYRILHDASEADDLLQEVFLYLHRKANLFEARRGTARSWIVQVTYHRAIDRRRYLVSRHFYSTNEVENTAAGLDESRTEIAFYERSIEGTLGKELARKISEALTENQRKIIQRSEVKEQACRAWPDCARRCP